MHTCMLAHQANIMVRSFHRGCALETNLGSFQKKNCLGFKEVESSILCRAVVIVEAGVVGLPDLHGAAWGAVRFSRRQHTLARLVFEEYLPSHGSLHVTHDALQRSTSCSITLLSITAMPCQGEGQVSALLDCDLI
jgi:hypothetical protein